MALTLFGYGKTMQAIAKKFGGECTIFDDTFTHPSTDPWGNTLLPTHLFDPDNSTLEVTSPGIAPNHPLIKSAKNLISEYDLFAEDTPFSIWISGTNGKTTTTQMIYHLLKDKGAQVGGNIGYPLADLDPHAPLWILETSSFTIHYTTKARPNLYVLLPITPDHVTWHGSMEAYEADKLKPLAWMEEGEIALLPTPYSATPSEAYKIGYQTAEDLAQEFGIDLAKLRFKGVFLIDALLALAVHKILFDTIPYEMINTFVIDGHRQEEVKDDQGRLWIDDSKATNLDATIEAVKIYSDRPLHLILGGDDKGADLSTLFTFLNGQDLTIYAIGSNATKIADLSQKASLACHVCHTLDVAVTMIDKVHTTQSAALLSPAAASLDQFSSYKERGEKFQSYIKSLS